PRALREHSVAQAIRARLDGGRIFALTVDERGLAELHDWTDSGPISIRRFRADLNAAEAATIPRPALPPARLAARGDWTGDVDPSGLPFRPGLVAEPRLFGFDADGEWLVIAGLDGVLHGLAMDGTPAEVLPRPYFDGVVLKQIDALLGVPGGIVACGRMKI